MTQDSVNYLSNTRGFDKSQISVKDLVWVLSLQPTLKTLNTWDRRSVLEQARLPRSSVIDSGNPYFFRVHEFILATNPRHQRHILGIVLAVNRRGPHAEVTHIHVAFEGCREAVRITQSLCDFPLDQIERENLLVAEARPNVFCAMRFSHQAISVIAQDFLTNAVRRFLPAYPDEAILPLRVARLSPENLQWVQERLGPFTSYINQPQVARHRMAKLFAMASAALAAQATIADDRSTHHVTASVPSLASIPLHLELRLPAMPSEGGWTRSRPADIWIVDSDLVLRTRVAGVSFSASRRTIHVELRSEARTHNTLRNAIRRFGTVDTETNNARIELCVRLGRIPSGTDPTFEFLASDDLATLLRPNRQTVTHSIMDTVYASPPRPAQDERHGAPPAGPSFNVQLRDRFIRLREDQAQAVRMGTSLLPLLAIQAAYGMGKTVVGAYFAARLAQPGQLVVATATTKVAVAQFADTLLAIDGNQHNVTALRFVADSALQEGAPTIAVDLHRILTGLLVNYSDSLSPQEQERLQQYIRGRPLIERVLFHPEATLHMTDQEREEYRIAANHTSLATERAVTMMLRVRFPTILCITIFSLLNREDSSTILFLTIASS